MKEKQELNIYKLIWIFAIGGVLGYLIETVWYYIVNGYYLCRQGVIYGPFSPIYGFGAVILTLFLYGVRHKNAIVIILYGGLLGSIFEYICSFLQEQVMGTYSWDYSKTPFNIHGRINLQMAAIWGFLGYIFIRSTYPYLTRILNRIPIRPRKTIAVLLALFLTFDMGLSVAALYRQKERREGQSPENKIEEFLDMHYGDELLDNIYTRVRVGQRPHQASDS